MATSRQLFSRAHVEAIPTERSFPFGIDSSEQVSTSRPWLPKSFWGCALEGCSALCQPLLANTAFAATTGNWEADIRVCPPTARVIEPDNTTNDLVV